MKHGVETVPLWRYFDKVSECECVCYSLAVKSQLLLIRKGRLLNQISVFLQYGIYASLTGNINDHLGNNWSASSEVPFVRHCKTWFGRNLLFYIGYLRRFHLAVVFMCYVIMVH